MSYYLPYGTSESFGVYSRGKKRIKSLCDWFRLLAPNWIWSTLAWKRETSRTVWFQGLFEAIDAGVQVAASPFIVLKQPTVILLDLIGLCSSICSWLRQYADDIALYICWLPSDIFSPLIPIMLCFFSHLVHPHQFTGHIRVLGTGWHGSCVIRSGPCHCWPLGHPSNPVMSSLGSGGRLGRERNRQSSLLTVGITEDTSSRLSFNFSSSLFLQWERRLWSRGSCMTALTTRIR